MAKLIGIAQRNKKRAPMQLLNSATISLETGVASDFRGKPGKRQITVLTTEGWNQACDEVNATIPWTARRANLLIEGIDLENSSNSELKIGSAILLITRETDPCKRMKEVHPGLYDALKPDWRGGVCCRVLRAGKITLGDNVELIHDN